MKKPATALSKTISPRCSAKTFKALQRIGKTTNNGAESVLATFADLAELPMMTVFANPLDGVAYAAGAFSSLYRTALVGMIGSLSAQELKLIIDVMATLPLAPESAGKKLRSSAWDCIHVEGLDKKYSVDPDIIVEKLDAMNRLELAALEVWARGYWESGSTSPQALEKYVRALA